MGTNFNDTYFCNMHRREPWNNKIFRRNNVDNTLETLFSSRPSSTRQVEYPILDCIKNSNITIAKTAKHHISNNFTGNSSGPYSGYNVDLETQLSNRNTVLQKCPQSKYIPNSNSDMYENGYLTPLKDKNLNLLAQKQETFMGFNPNKCRIGIELFNNHTRQQTKDVKLR